MVNLFFSQLDCMSPNSGTISVPIVSLKYSAQCWENSGHSEYLLMMTVAATIYCLLSLGMLHKLLS